MEDIEYSDNLNTGMTWHDKVRTYLNALNHEGVKRIAYVLLTDKDGKNAKLIRNQIERYSELN